MTLPELLLKLDKIADDEWEKVLALAKDPVTNSEAISRLKTREEAYREIVEMCR